LKEAKEMDSDDQWGAPKWPVTIPLLPEGHPQASIFKGMAVILMERVF